jgi:small-conductance mechanosensitive channel
MNTLKRFLGLVWMALALVTAYFCSQVFLPKLSSGKQEDLVFGIIIFFVLLPLVVAGLFVFGYYSLTNEYED